MTALNPLHRIADQVAEALTVHGRMLRAPARTEAIRLLDRVGLPDAARRGDAYPHQLSGGQRQRVTIAMALACGPDILIADEPTTALDVTIQGQILDLIDELVAERNMALILISHDLGVIAENVNRMLVMYGGTIVESGPTVDQLTRFNEAPATEPIRAYAGLNSADGITATAELAAQELQRTGGLQRAVVAVGTTTGMGWINEAEADALEYMYNGNTAIVSMQYSFLPSWLSFLVDKENARHAGQALFEAVDRLVRHMPEGHRPKLVVFGESLGSFGGEAPFMSLNNVLARTDGALFSGPTFNNTIWTDLTSTRDAGSPQWLPIYNDGRNVRFVARSSDLMRPNAGWDRPRVVYLQHASDPIAWWTTDLLFSKPDWLRETRGYDVLPQTRWIPVVTFLQVTADMAVAQKVPPGHGHDYVADVADGWAAVLSPPGWTQQKTDRLRPLLHAGD